MNIFLLDKDPVKCAVYHCDRHVIKMITEYCQIISTAIREQHNKEIFLKKENLDLLYKSTHKNHPIIKWASLKWINVLYLANLTQELIKEYHIRYGINNNFIKAKSIMKMINPPLNIEIDFNKMPQCMPKDCQNKNIIIAYRNYYKTHKVHLLSYTNREIPLWL